MRRGYLRAAAVAAPLLMAGAAAAEGTRDFHADLAAEWQTKYTESPGIGHADFHLDIPTMTFSWDVSFKDLTGPLVLAAVYGPAQPGANGAKFLEIAGKGARSPLRGSAKLTDAQVQYLLYGWTYVNLITEKYPLGEIRGQLDVRPPQEARQ